MAAINVHFSLAKWSEGFWFRQSERKPDGRVTKRQRSASPARQSPVAIFKLSVFSPSPLLESQASHSLPDPFIAQPLFQDNHIRILLVRWTKKNRTFRITEDLQAFVCCLATLLRHKVAATRWVAKYVTQRPRKTSFIASTVFSLYSL